MTRAEDLAVLELSEGVSSQKIRQKYKQLARRDHPDKGGSKEAFQRLSDAYERLSGPRDDSNGSEVYEYQSSARDSYSDDDQDDFMSNCWYNQYYYFFQRRWNSPDTRKCEERLRQSRLWRLRYVESTHISLVTAAVAPAMVCRYNDNVEGRKATQQDQMMEQ